MTQLDLFTEEDRKRAGGQRNAVMLAMISGRWLTLEEIRGDIKYVYGIEATTQSISARLRDLRKPQFGGHTVERQRVSGGLFRYRLSTRTE